MNKQNNNRLDIVDSQVAEQDIYHDLPETIKNKLSWFQDQKLGIIFHWGLYSQAGIVESWQLSKEDNWARKHGAWRSDLATLRRDYWNLEQKFNPVNFNPENWAKAAKNAGFKYMIFTTKHHDGFNMYDTKYSDYKITDANCAFHTNCRADVLKYINKAFQQEGIATGAYYSKADWHSSAYWEPNSDPKGRYASYDPLEKPQLWRQFQTYVENQLVEICQNYGPIDILWLDAGWVNSMHHENLPMAEIAREIWKIKPDTLIVDRTIGGSYENYVTPEQKIPEIPPKKVWESNITLAKNWGYVPNDQYKSFTEILKSIIAIITLGGNVILGIGPKPDGTLPQQAIMLMSQLGDWLKIFGDAVYGTRGCPEAIKENLRLTKKGKTYFLFFAKNEGGRAKNIAALPIENSKVVNLESKEPVAVTNNMVVLPITSYPYGVLKFSPENN